VSQDPIDVETNAGRYEIAAVANALKIIAYLGEHGPTSLNDLVLRSGLSRSATYRILMTLESHRFAIRDRTRGQWSLGPTFFSIHRNGRHDALKVLAMPSLDRLHAKFMETTNLAELFEGRLTYIEILQSPQPLAARETPGDEAPLATTALGRAVLAALATADPLAEKVSLESRNPRKLKAEVAAVRRRQWAIEQGETATGVACIGAAIIGPSGAPVGGISVSLPEARLSPSRAKDIGRAVLLEAQKVSASLKGN
jgi:DNA-binding IclR family transcriptional regulator